MPRCTRRAPGRCQSSMRRRCHRVAAGGRGASRWSGRRRDPMRPSHGVMRYLLEPGLRRACPVNPNCDEVPRVSAATRRSRMRSRPPGPSTSSTSSDAPSTRPDRPQRRGHRRRRAMAPARCALTGRPPRIAHDAEVCRSYGPLHGDRAPRLHAVRLTWRRPERSSSGSRKPATMSTIPTTMTI